MKKILITGSNGFIGHHFCEHIIKKTDWQIFAIDKLTYASFGFDRLKDVNVFNINRIQLYTYDFTKPLEGYLSKQLQDVNYIVHMGAETHVDRSIEDPKPFVLTNVLGTMNMLQFARTCKNLEKFIYFSTDEVFGPAVKEFYPYGFLEWDRYNSSNPYAATKAAGEELCLAWQNTYKVPVIITHTMNVFGERQHPEKFIPLIVKKILNNELVHIHADKECKVPGSRFWIHARNVAAAIMFILDKGRIRDKYNIVGEKELNNLELADSIADLMCRDLRYELVDFHSSRPGHDLRYALCGTKLKEMGFNMPKDFMESLDKTISWMLENKRWLDLKND